ncbi:hypothetical protein FRB94_013959 [Tulasnella sp. JGI-2019a]|nr:hypothetical protein FRB94_013959 [Tulasnella sp. JGI-2019a]
MPPKTQAYMDSILNINRAPNYGRVDDDDDTTKALIQEPQYGYSAKDTPMGYPPSYPPASEYSSDRGPVRPRPKQVVPMYLRPWFLAVLIFFMLLLAAAVQVALYRSQQTGGFVVPNIDDFGGANFLKSAVPVILAGPVSTLFMKMDGALVGMHPYVALAQGRTTAERSLLLSYGGNRLNIIRRALMNSHYLVVFSSILCLLTTALSPLASGVLTSRGVGVNVPNIRVASQKSLGMIPDANTLETFLAAAGYASAAAVQPLGPAPFTLGSWAVAQFTVPPPSGPGQNGTVFVPTTAIQTESGCGTPDTYSGTETNGVWSFQASWSGCNVTITATDTNSDQVGVDPVPLCTGDGVVISQFAQFQPVVFWFFSNSLKQGNMVFCQPKSFAYNVIAGVDLSSSQITAMTVVDQNVASNNFTGPPTNGQTYNGVQFDLSAADAVTKARALAIQSSLPDAIARAARTASGGLAGLISTNSGQGLLDVTNRTYSQFLATVAQTTYFFDNQVTINSKIVNWEIRLWVYPIAAHAFTGLLVLIASLSAIVHYFHARARKDVYMSADPSTVAGVVTMTSESQWIKILQAGDDDKAIAQKLAGRRFGISRRTWQIVADGEEERAYPGASGDRTSLLSHADSGKVDPWDKR